METLFQDVRYALRSLRNSPSFTIVALLALALGIGANAAMFTIVNAVILRPLPYKDSGRLVYLMEAFKRRPGMSFSYPEFQDYHNQNHVFDGMAAVQGEAFILTGGSTPQHLNGRNVTSEFFGTLGVKPLPGRDFVDSDDQARSAPTAIIGYGLWQRRFGGDPQIVGKTVTMNDRDYTIIGVLPQGFTYRDQQYDVFVPLGLHAGEEDVQRRSSHGGIYCVARLKPGVSLKQAQADLDTIGTALEQQYPQSNKNVSVAGQLLQDRVVGGARPVLLMLFGAVSFVLLIACANIANLLLTRASMRERELAIRSALGAARSRIIRQLLTESVLLAFIGGAIGIALAIAGVKLVVNSAPDALPRAQEIHVDGAVLLFTLLISIVTGVLFGVLPALQASARQFVGSLKEGITSSVGVRKQRLRSALVVSEIALSLALLAGAGLLIRSFVRVLHVDPGFDSRQVLTAEIALPEKKYSKPEQVEAFYDEVFRNLRGQPGVKTASAIWPMPLSGNEWDTDYLLEGKPMPSAVEIPSTRIYHASPDYFTAMQIPILEGRQFLESDNDSSLPVVLISREFARRNFAGMDPIGRKFRMGGRDELTSTDLKKFPWLTIVGVVGDVKHDNLESETPMEIYVPFAQHTGRHTLHYRMLMLRSATTDPLSLTSVVRGAVMHADPDQPTSDVQSMDQVVSDSLGSRRLSMSLLMTFAGLALILAVIGIYGVMSYSVTQRTQEIGIRMALGADRKEVMLMIARQAFRLVAIGLAVGVTLAIGLSFGLSRVLAGQLFGVKATDPVTFAAVAATLAFVALLASGVPARRATRINPVQALRHE
jgi:putative ABC transport system permease protein